MKLADLHLKYDTDKGTSHSYIETYDMLFERFQDQPINFCEIGALTCGSLKMFEAYFTQAQIIGVDNWIQSENSYVKGFQQQSYNVNELIDDIHNNHKRITLCTCDSTNSTEVGKMFKLKQFKVIIDDGDHRVTSQFETYKNFISLLDDDGIYIVEDVDKWGTLQIWINEYNKEKQINLTVTPKPLLKNYRPDDVLLIISGQNI